MARIGMPQQPQSAGDAPMPLPASSSCVPKPFFYQTPDEIAWEHQTVVQGNLQISLPYGHT